MTNSAKTNEQIFSAIESGVGYSSDKTLAKYFDASRSTIWHWTRIGKLPKPEKLSTGTSRWDNRKIKEFVQEAANGASH
jgi:predicted DNA-binding transcriptional regulator AlpA